MMAMSEVKERIDERVWRWVTCPLAAALVDLGLMRHPRLLAGLIRAWPDLAASAVLLANVYGKGNRLLWWYDPDGDDWDGLLDTIDEIIVRAPSPYGLDEYRIVAEQYSPLPGEDVVDSDSINATLPKRTRLVSDAVDGDRYYDWKKGAGREAVREMLERVAPRPGAPVVVIRVLVNGTAVQRALRPMGT